MRNIFWIVVAVLVAYAVFQIARSFRLIRVGEGLASRAVPFARELGEPSFRILVAGDSTGVGTGASGPEASLAGLTGNKYPAASVTNVAVNGAKAHGVIAQLNQDEGTYDLVLLHVGGNDTVRFTDLEALRRDIRTILDLAVKKGSRVLLTSTGNVGTVPLFPAPTRWILDRRTRSVRSILVEEVALSGQNVRYTDLFREKPQDPFALDPATYYAADQFHPSDAGYRDWFGLMERELDLLDKR